MARRTSGQEPGRGPGRGPGRRRPVAALTAALVVAALVAAGGYLAWSRGGSGGGAGGGSGGAGAARAASSSTATVRRQDLVVTEKLSGTLGYADQRRIATPLVGTVTSTAPQGRTVGFGKALFAIDLRPTILLRGAVPAYRDLSTASADGPDVRQLERALVDLGHGAGLSVDEKFTSATADAVRAWERDLGRRDPNGTVTKGDVVFAETPLRVTAIDAAPGSPTQAGTAVLSVASTARVVDVDLEAGRSNDLDPGARVTLTLPDGRDTTGTVSSVGSRQQTSATDPQAAPTVPVVITVDRPERARAFDSGTVDVVLERSRDRAVLVLPVTALLALREGGYAVQVVDRAQAKGYHLSAVRIGTVTDGDVALTGAEIKPGVRVLVPS
jgi:hypothetical protein